MTAIVQPLLIDIDETPVDRPRRVPVRAHLRKVAGAETPSGIERANRVLIDFEARKATQGAIAYVRANLAELYEKRVRSRGPAFVTADDIDTILREWPQCPDEAKAEHGPQHWRGTVFRNRAWVQTGQSVPALRKHMNGTSLPCWKPAQRNVA